MSADRLLWLAVIVTTMLLVGVVLLFSAIGG
jgi:hypothetical protein